MTPAELNKLLITRHYNATSEPPAEQVVFRIQFQNIGSLGNFILLTGRPKSGKSKYISGKAASALTGKEVFGMQIKLPNEKNRVAHWDTEQNKYDYHAMIKLIQKLAGLDEVPKHFNSFHCRRDNAATIIAMVEYYLKCYPDTGVIILDGLLDMIDRFNDEGQSKMLVNFLKRITDEHNVLVIGVLHRSVTNDKSLGHVGSIADRAAQSVLIVEKNKEVVPAQYVLRAEYLRSADDFDPIAIYFNKQLHLWEQCDYIMPEDIQTEGRTRKKRPLEYDIQEHKDNCRRIFNARAELSYKNLVNEIKQIYALGDNLAKDFVPYLLKEGLIFKTDTGYTMTSQAKLFIQNKTA